MNLFVTVAKKSVGESFGEEVLIDDTRRSATITCETESWFATLDRQEFQKITKKEELRDLHRQLQFVHQIPLLKTLSNNMISKLIRCFKPKTLTYKELLFFQNDLP